MNPLMEPCGVCKGTGTVPHLKRRIGNSGEIDPNDHQVVEMCLKCGGCGQVRLNTARIIEPVVA